MRTSEERIEQIEGKHYADVLAYCRRHTVSPEEAADACQETFLRFVRRAGAYRERGKPLAYLITIARSVCVDLARTHARDADELPDGLPADAPGPDAADLDLALALERLTPADREILELLETVGLAGEERRRIRTFSGGMKQRLGIAQAVLNDPEVLVLDEPTAGLDPKERVRFRNLIAGLAQNRIVLLSTHIVSDVEYIADRIVMMRAGQAVLEGAPDKVVSVMSGKVWEVCAAAAEAERISERACVGNIHYLEGGQALVRVVADEPPAGAARRVDPTLEDLYLHVFADDTAQGPSARPAARHARGGRHA